MNSKVGLLRAPKLLAIEPGEYFKTSLLFLYLFVMTAATIVGRTAADTLFLSKFDVTKLSYMYLGISITLSITGTIFHAVVDRIRRDYLIYIVTSILTLFVLVTRFLVEGDNNWIYPTIYVSYEAINFILILQFWTFTNDVLDTRQTKRLIGIILSAGILGGMVIGFAIKGLVHQIGTFNLIFLYAGLMILCMLIVFLLSKREFKPEAAQSRKKKKVKQESGSIRNIYHLKLIALIVCMITMSLTFIDYQFKLVLKNYYQNEALAGVLGQFYGWTGIVSLIFQFFLSTRILTRFGILVSLIILPVFLLLSSLALIFYSEIPGQMALAGMSIYLMPLLNAAVFAKSSDKVFSDTIYSSASQLMYVPLPTSVRGRAKVFVDGMMKPLSKGFAAAALIFSVLYFPVAVHEISYFVIALLLIAIVAIVLVKREYVKSLYSTLRTNPIDFKDISLNVNDISAIEILVGGLASPDERRVLYCLEALKNIEGFYLLPHVMELLNHKAAAVRIEALQILERLTPRQAVGELLLILEDEKETAVRVQAILTLAAYADDNNIKRILAFLIDEDPLIKGAAIAGLMLNYGIDGIFYSVDIFKEMMDSPRVEDRKEIARIIGRIGLKNFHKPLVRLFEDPSKEVQVEAIEAAHRIHATDLIPQVIKKLKQKETRHKAMEALSVYAKEDIIPALRVYVEFSAQYKEISVYVPRVFEMIASQECADILFKSYASATPYLRLKILDSLTKIRFRIRDLAINQEDVKKLVFQEIDEHRFFTSALYALKPFDGIAILIEGINSIRKLIFERVFKLLTFSFDPKVILTVHHNIVRSDKRIQSNAIEVLDNMMEGELRSGLLDVVNSQVTPKFYAEKNTKLLFDALKKAYHKDYEWVKMCIEFVSTSPRFDEWDHDSAFSLRKVIHDTHVDFERKELINIIQKVAILKKVSFFTNLSGEYLATIASMMKSVKRRAKDIIFFEGDPGDSFYIIVKGKVLIHKGEMRLVEMGPGQCFGEMAILDNEKRSASVTALEDTLMFQLESEAFYDIISDKIEIAKSVIRMLTARLRTQLAKVAASGGGPPKSKVEAVALDEQRFEEEAALMQTTMDTHALLKRVLILKEIDLFASLSDEDVILLANSIGEVEVKKGQDVFLEGDEGDAMYGIISGAVLIHKGGRDLATLRETQYFGEMAILDNEPRSASVTAVEDTRLIQLSSDDFYSLVFDKIDIMRNIFAVLTRRLRETSK